MTAAFSAGNPENGPHIAQPAAGLPGHHDQMTPLLNLIESTSQFARQAQEYAGYHIPGVTSITPRETMTRLSQDAVQLGRLTINQMLEEMGGISHHFSDSETGVTIPCRLQSWQGVDPDNIQNDLWSIAGLTGSVVSIETSMLDEIRRKLE